MPIRIRPRDKPVSKLKATEYEGLGALLAAAGMVSYAGRKPELGILCGSI
jgi:hypothetical protein